MQRADAPTVASERSSGNAAPRQRLSLRWVTLCGLVVAVCSLPVLLNIHPPLYDYPFYIARLFILNELPDNAFLADHYVVSSFLIPNIGMELILLPLVRVMSYHAAFDVFIILIFASIVTGAAFMYRTLFRDESLWPLVTGLFVVNWIFLFGFLNYMLGVGLFLWGFAVWIRLSRAAARSRLLCGSLIAVGLFFVHLASFGLYAVAVFGYELQRMVGSVNAHGRRALPSALAGMASSGIQFLVPAALFVASSTRNAGESGSIHYKLMPKVAAPIVTLTSGDPWLDVLMGLTLVSAAIMVLLFGRIRISVKLIGSFVCLALAYLALPHILAPAAFVDSRIPIAVVFMLLAASQVTFARRSWRIAFVTTVACLFVIKTIMITQDWREHDTLIQEYLAAYDQMKDRSTMYAAARDLPVTWTRKHYDWRRRSPVHVADLATLTGRIFVPTVFAQPGQHTIAVRERFADVRAYQTPEPIAVADGEELSRVVDALILLHRQASPDSAAYLLLQDRGEAPLALPQGVRVIASGSGFRLIEVYAPG